MVSWLVPTPPARPSVTVSRLTDTDQLIRSLAAAPASSARGSRSTRRFKRGRTSVRSKPGSTLSRSTRIRLLSTFTHSSPSDSFRSHSRERSTGLGQLFSQVLVRVQFNLVLLDPVQLDQERQLPLPPEFLTLPAQLCSVRDTLPARCL